MALGDYSEQAGAYGRTRPGYPQALLVRLLDQLEVRAGANVVDLGAGTGLFTRLLVEVGMRVTAVEPCQAMRHQAPPLANVNWVDGTFERTGLADSSQDWAVAAHSFHWSQPATALPEIKRILSPNGYFTIVVNERTTAGNNVLTWTTLKLKSLVPEYEGGLRQFDWGSLLRSTDDFGEVQYMDVRHVHSMTCEHYLELWRSHNRLTTIAGPQRLDVFLHALNGYLRSEHLDGVEVPYVCRAWSARRLGPVVSEDTTHEWSHRG
jgi:SAM-dependent methyltransferase